MDAKRIFLFFSLAVVVSVAVFWLWLTCIPEARSFTPPALTQWIPTGPRMASLNHNAVNPLPDAFRTMHVGASNSDEVWTVVAPAYKLDWVAEPDMFIAEGPTFDNAGNLYFSPNNPREDISLVALDAQTGKRKWVIPGKGDGAGCGAPLVLNDPDKSGTQLIYHSTYTDAMVLRPDGSKAWSVPTGLSLPPRKAGERSQTHVWGMNYHPQADAVFAVTMDGWVYAHDRLTGAPLLATPFQLPGVPAKSIAARIPPWLMKLANQETDATFGATADGLGLFASVLDVIYGNGVRVANFYAIDQNSGSIFIAATAPDEEDGKTDGVADNGALYRLELTGDKQTGYQLKVADAYYFSGGTGSTPTVSADGELVMVSDDNGNVIALDKRLKEIWRVNLGAQVAASIAVSSSNGEMYAVTAHDIVKLRNHGDRASIVWRAKLDAYPGFDNFNALTPTIAANGILISVGGGRALGGTQLLSKFGSGLLDRETGALRWFAEGREESIAVSSMGPDGAPYTAGSPIRRAVARGLLGDSLPPLVGGITRYKPVRNELLARDAVCAASNLATRMHAIDPANIQSRRDDLAQIGVLLNQSNHALFNAARHNDLSLEQATRLRKMIEPIQANLAARNSTVDLKEIKAVCLALDLK
jgi:outer membrane protein assembly factor BamB